MNHDAIITKAKASNAYKNGTIVLNQTGKGNFGTIDTYASNPTSPSGEMDWSSRLTLPGEFVYTTAAP